ncbi:hypothetical protein BJ508DRAFT_310951 [Ascobolus immersus RN42]|uniref:Uncharacterized protein n=1 Tax=Ascobolus immersus RN42 TaxID=1160509 RepID=A0A3N4HRS4_ASCIM|nr:hypothetical protein BJ508DRAFT_310951 [Ascobolus immersus RN42]
MAKQFIIGEYVSIESLCPEQKGVILGRIVRVISLRNENRYIVRTPYGLLHGAYFDFELSLVRNHKDADISLAPPSESEKKGSLIQALVYQRAVAKIKPKQPANGRGTAPSDDTQPERTSRPSAEVYNSTAHVDKSKGRNPSFQGYRDGERSFSSSPLPPFERHRPEEHKIHTEEATGGVDHTLVQDNSTEYESPRERIHHTDEVTDYEDSPDEEDRVKIKREHFEEEARKERLQFPQDADEPAQPVNFTPTDAQSSNMKRNTRALSYEGKFGY